MRRAAKRPSIPIGFSRSTPISGLPEFLTIPECARWLKLGRNFVYELAKSGQLHTVKIGSLLRVPKAALAELVNNRMESENR
jgi:excisionase family DNA binding protein